MKRLVAGPNGLIDNIAIRMSFMGFFCFSLLFDIMKFGLKVRLSKTFDALWRD